VNAGHAIGEAGGIVRVEVADIDIDGTRSSAIRAGTPDAAPYPVRTETEADGTARLWIGGLHPGPHVKLTVTDDGQGMDARTLARIFDPFFTTKDVGKGTGLGLVAVQGIVLASGGAIAVRTAPGHGTTFKVLLPKAAPLPAAEASDPKTLHPGTGSILFVDDEPSLVRIGQRTLERAGYRVVGYSDSVAALDAFIAEPRRWDLVITDQTMPIQTGAEMARVMLKLRPELPIILCSGFTDSLDSKAVHAMGIRAFVMKPVVGPELTELVHATLSKKPGHMAA
jgi:CheY-like chemotaxis protein